MSTDQPTRRDFVKTSAAVTTGGAIVSSLATSAYAAGSEVIKVGLIGCGGRGTGAANQALHADSAVQLVAMGDAFEDRLEKSLQELQRLKDVADRVNVPKEHRFVGFDAYKQVTDLVDVVVLATPPYFRPMQLRYAVENSKHAFVEKPVATDGPGTRDILATCELAKQKGLSVVSGLCWRYDTGKRELFKRIHGGEIGDITSIHTYYNSSGVWDPRVRRDQCKTDMEYQMRNWYYYCWLSGDHIVEQAVHAIDKMGWAMHDKPPVEAWAVGGRQVRTAPEYGNIYDHFAVVYQYDNGVRGFHHCRHWKGADGGVKDFIMGSKGVADTMALSISGGPADGWRFRDKTKNMYQVEHDELFAAIKAGTPINNGQYMCRSTLLAIMGRMAAYTGKTVTWDKALNSQEAIGPAKLEWGPLEAAPVPIPGITKLA